MNLRALYVSKLAKCPLICPGDLVGDRWHLASGIWHWQIDRGGRHRNMQQAQAHVARDQNAVCVLMPDAGTVHFAHCGHWRWISREITLAGKRVFCWFGGI
jgi:hypothetical protein